MTTIAAPGCMPQMMFPDSSTSATSVFEDSKIGVSMVPRMESGMDCGLTGIFFLKASGYRNLFSNKGYRFLFVAWNTCLCSIHPIPPWPMLMTMAFWLAGWDAQNKLSQK
jgi:hypothetical protein